MIRQRTTIAALAVSAAALVGIAVHEGWSDTPYLDSVGVPTIGFGRTEGVRPHEKTTVGRELIALLRDAEGRKAAIAGCVSVPLYQHELDAYMSLTYNIGNAAFCRSTLAKKLNAGDYAAACAEILRWNKAGGRVLPGLVKRRQAEYRLCLGETVRAAADVATADR